MVYDFFDGTEGSGEHIFESYRSLRTTRIFLADEQTLGDLEPDMDTTDLRESIDYLVNYINEHQGWTVVGWSRTGKIRDMSNDKEDIANEHVNPHLILVYPTSPYTISEPDYRRHKYRYRGNH